MSCARTGRHRPSGPVGRRYRRHLRLTLLLLIAAGTERVTPAAAQLATGLPPPGSVPITAAPAGTPPPGGEIPTVLPPPPVGPIGLPSPLAPPNTLPYGLPTPQTAAPVSPLSLPSPGAGITTLQAYDPNAPAILIQPYASLSERLTDNVFFTHTHRTAAAETMLSPGVSISADTPRFQGVLSASASGDLYVPTGSLNQVVGDLYGRGTGTILPDRMFVDLSSLITQATTLPGLGFVNPSLLPSSQQTQVFVNTVSPYVRESIDGLVDSELRYTFGSSNFGGNTISGTPALNTNLGTGILNEGTFTAATGRDFERGLSRLTVDASDFNSPSVSRNTQFSGYDDLEFRIRPNIAALARIGYQNIRYPFVPAATFAGATWLIGGRVGLGGNYGYASLEYGRQQGVYGFTGSANFQITPTITFVASLVQGISSPSEYLQGSLLSSALSPNGSIVDEYSGLPTAFYSPGLGFTTNVYREHLFNAVLTDQIGVNSYSLYGYYSDQQALTPPVTGPTKSAGANFIWGRDIRPDLNGSASLGYTRTTNAISINSTTPISSVDSLTAYVGLNYLFARSLSGSLLYSFSYQPNGGLLTNGRSGDVVVNSLQLILTKSF